MKKKNAILGAVAIVGAGYLASKHKEEIKECTKTACKKLDKCAKAAYTKAKELKA